MKKCYQTENGLENNSVTPFGCQATLLGQRLALITFYNQFEMEPISCERECCLLSTILNRNVLFFLRAKHELNFSISQPLEFKRLSN